MVADAVRVEPVDIEILRSFAAAPAPPKPRHRDRAGGAGSRSTLGARKLTTVPLQSERIASHFSTMSLRGLATFDRSIKADGTTAAVLVRVSPRRRLLLRQRDAPALAALGQ